MRSMKPFYCIVSFSSLLFSFINKHQKIYDIYKMYHKTIRCPMADGIFSNFHNLLKTLVCLYPNLISWCTERIHTLPIEVAIIKWNACTTKPRILKWWKYWKIIIVAVASDGEGNCVTAFIVQLRWRSRHSPLCRTSITFKWL